MHLRNDFRQHSPKEKRCSFARLFFASMLPGEPRILPGERTAPEILRHLLRKLEQSRPPMVSTSARRLVREFFRQRVLHLQPTPVFPLAGRAQLIRPEARSILREVGAYLSTQEGSPPGSLQTTAFLLAQGRAIALRVRV